MSLRILPEYAGDPKGRAHKGVPKTAAPAPQSEAKSEPAKAQVEQASTSIPTTKSAGPSSGLKLGATRAKAPGGGSASALTLGPDSGPKAAQENKDPGASSPAAGATSAPAAQSVQESGAADSAESAQATSNASATKPTEAKSVKGPSLGISKAKAPGGGAAGELSLGGTSSATPAASATAEESSPSTSESAQESAQPVAAKSAPKAPGGKGSGGLSLGGATKAKAPGGVAAGAVTLGAATAATAAASSQGDQTASNKDADSADSTVSKADAPADKSAAGVDATPSTKAAPEVIEPTELESVTEESTTTVPARALKRVRAFVTRHGGEASVVLQPVGRVGVRMTLVGADGTLGDVMVDTLAEAEVLRDTVSELSQSEWDRELISRVDVPAKHWSLMAGSGRLV